MNYNQNEIKILKNSEVILYQEVILEISKNNYKELEELFQLFSKNESPEKISYLEKKFGPYKKLYFKKIKENKRLLTNTKKRLEYNMGKCSKK